MSEQPNRSVSSPTAEEFVLLITQHQRRIFQYILSLHPVLSDAEDILQEVNLVLWRKIDDFKNGTNFAAWAVRISHFEVLKHRRRQHLSQIRFMDQDLMEQIAQEAAKRVEHTELVSEALQRCLSRLRPADLSLITRRYSEAESGKNLAMLIGRPQKSVYKSIGRIRRALFECVKQSLDK